MAAVIVAPHPRPRSETRPALRLVVSSTPTRPVLAPRRPAPHRADAATYRRRRFVVALAALVSIVAVWSAASAWTGASDPAVLTAAATGAAPTAEVVEAPAAATPPVYVVRPGDTMWTIAQRLAPEGDIRELVDQLTERAGGSGLQAGQRIALDGLGL